MLLCRMPMTTLTTKLMFLVNECRASGPIVAASKLLLRRHPPDHRGLAGPCPACMLCFTTHIFPVSKVGVLPLCHCAIAPLLPLFQDLTAAFWFWADFCIHAANAMVDREIQNVGLWVWLEPRTALPNATSAPCPN